MIAVVHSYASHASEITETIDDLLVVWWLWSASDRPHLGASRCSPMFRDAKPAAGNVHDEADEADRRIRGIKARGVEAEIDRLPSWRHKVATELRAATLAGKRVRESKVLTEDEIHDYWQEAKKILIPRLQDAGLLG